MATKNLPARVGKGRVIDVTPRTQAFQQSQRYGDMMELADLIQQGKVKPWLLAAMLRTIANKQYRKS